jgi:predicted Zn-ribbon and HTH transcriptional regulator
MRTGLPDSLRHARRIRANRRDHAAIRVASDVPTRVADLAVERARSSGGPLDEASYVCACGFVFRAPVSTTVACPHCRATQAW